MAIVGYARVSTTDQKLEVQLEALEKVGAERIYQEKASGADSERVELAALLDYVRDGDTVIACKLDRLARSTKHLLEIVEKFNTKKVILKILNIDLDSSTPTGKLMLTMLGAIAQFEKEMMLERQADGIKKAKEAGVYTGRKPTARAKSAEVLSLLDQGKTKADVASTLKMGVASVYRIAKETRTKALAGINAYSADADSCSGVIVKCRR
jgi:DNA invertase Pin-like site-specific DNA recombinase